MATRASGSARGAGSRPRRVPAPLVEGGERYEGEAILAEQAGDLAVALWKSCLNVTLWAGVAAPSRAALFSPGAEAGRRAELGGLGLEPEVEEALGEVAALLGDPAGASAGAVGRACRVVAGWAEREGRSGTALAFAQAAALAEPDDAGHACAVGKLARARAEFGRAETWYERAILVAIRQGDRESYVRAQIGIGKVLWHRGALPAARRSFLRALRAARRHGFRVLQGWALHDLAAVAIHAGKLREPMRYFRAAREAFGPAHELVPRLINDIAYAWASAGHFARALPPLLLLRDYPFPPAERLTLMGSIARAAGGAGEERHFAEAAREIEETTSAGPGDAHADALLDLAHGAASLGRWDEARRAGERALRLADATSEARVRLLAEALLDSVVAERRVREQPRPLPADAERLVPLGAELLDAARESAAAA